MILEQLAPEDVIKVFNKALNNFLGGKLADAKIGFEQVIQANPKSAEAFLNLGNVFFVENNIDEAIKNFEKCIEIDPTITKAYINIGNCFFKKDKLDTAIGYWQVGANLSPDNAVVHRNIAVAFEKLNNLQNAFKHYELFLRCNKKIDNMAIKIRRKVEESKKAAYHNLTVGITYQKKKKLKEAAMAFKKSIEIYPNFAKAHLNLGSIYFLSNQIDEAIASWEKSLLLDPEFSNLYCNLGVAYDKKLLFDEAYYYYKRYIDITNGKTSDAKQVKERLDELKEKVKTQKDAVKQHVMKGDSYFKNKQYEQAILEFKKYMILNPDGSDIASIKKRIDEAQDRLNPIPRALSVSYKMGNDYFSNAKYDKALTAFNRYLSLDPSGPQAKDVREKIDQCHKLIGAVVSAMLKSG